MKNILFLILSIFILFFISCNERDEITENIKYHFQIKNIEFDKNIEHCVILPEVGCEGCIDAGVRFFLENKEHFFKTQDKNIIIFTSINSKKILFRKLNLNNLNDYNYVLDLENDYLVPGNNSIYPLVLLLKDGRILKAEYQSPFSRDILSEIKRKLRD